MKMNANKQWISGFLLYLFISFYIGILQFPHTHVINGVTIVHSHFHGGSHGDTPSGGHTDTELTLIDAVSGFETLAPVFSSIISMPECPVCEIQSEVTFCKPHIGFHDFFFLRGPPIVLT